MTVVETRRVRAAGRAAGFALAAVAGLLGGAPARAADTFDLTRKDVWKVGDVVGATIREQDDRDWSYVTDNARTPAYPPQTITVSAAILEKAIEVDTAGAKTRSLVVVTAFLAKDGVLSDTSLEGALLDVKGAGKDRTVTVVTSKGELGKVASSWMQRRYGGGRQDPGASKAYWLPKVPVAIGDTWTADLASFFEANSVGARLDRSRTTSSATLTAVAKGHATIACEASLALATFPGGKGGKPWTWASGGVQVIKGSYTTTLSEPIATGSLAFTTLLEGSTEVDGKVFAIRFASERKVTETLGGAWPADAKLPDAPPPPK
jgi:hypothetical protein